MVNAVLNFTRFLYVDLSIIHQTRGRLMSECHLPDEVTETWVKSACLPRGGGAETGLGSWLQSSAFNLEWSRTLVLPVNRGTSFFADRQQYFSLDWFFHWFHSVSLTQLTPFSVSEQSSGRLCSVGLALSCRHICTHEHTHDDGLLWRVTACEKQQPA